MKVTPLVFCTLFLLSVSSFADITEDITLTDGTEYKNVVVLRAEKDSLVVQTDDGIQRLPMALVPKEVQLVHPYVPPATPTPAPTPEEPKVVSTPVPTPKPQPLIPPSTNSGDSMLMGLHWGSSCEPFIKAAAAALVVLLPLLFIAWFIAGRLVSGVAQRRKQREFDSANAQQFLTAYMDFYAIWKLWSHYLDHGENELPDHGEYEIPHASRWELLTRTYIAEGSIESLFLKLSSSRKMSPGAIELLGRFRQAFQTLGVAIKNNKPMAWKDPEHPDYLMFKRLASSVSALMSGENLGVQAADLRADAFRQITSARWERSWSSESSHPSS